MIRTRLTDLLGCTAPIQQAPMGTVSSPRLAVAVAEAGGIGSFNTLGVARETLRRQLDTMREQTDGVLAVSFLTDDIDVDAVADAASRVRVVDFFWSRPRPDLVDIAHRGGALVIWQVGSVGEARAAVQAGADIVCAQGVEAGGHCRGDSPLLPLLCEVLDAVDVPVLAAGGIGDARGVAAALAAGASGVRMGTRFIATEESAAHAERDPGEPEHAAELAASQHGDDRGPHASSSSRLARRSRDQGCPTKVPYFAGPYRRGGDV